MRKKSYKGRCDKQSLDKFTTVCKTYEPLQSVYANILAKSQDIVEARCNVVLDGEDCSKYMTDFVCIKTDGELMVRECMSHKLLSSPQMAKLLDLSRTYWLRRGVKDWGIVTDATKE